MPVLLLTAIGLLGARSSHAATSPIGWQLQQGDLSVVVEGDKDLAIRTADRVRKLQRAARLLLDWPPDYNPPPALIFAVHETTIRDVFSQPATSASVRVSPSGSLGSALESPQLTMIVFPRNSVRGREFEALHFLYGNAMLAVAQAAKWPECPRLGFSMLFTAADFSGSGHFVLPANKVVASKALDPAELFESANPTEMTQAMRDRRGYSCYLLSHLMAWSPVDTRRAFNTFFGNLGDRISLDKAVPEGLGGSLAEFTTRFRRFAASREFRPRDFLIDVELPDPVVHWPEPVAIDGDRLNAMLQQVCGKLDSCRHKPGTGPGSASLNR